MHTFQASKMFEDNSIDFLYIDTAHEFKHVEKEISLWEVLNRAQEFGFKGGTLEAIENFVLMIKSFASMLKKSNAYDVAFHVGKQTGLVRELFNDKSTEGVQRYVAAVQDWYGTRG